MMKSLNDNGQRAIELAAEAARAMNHDFVGTEHLLLGVMREASAEISYVLARLGLKIEQALEEIEKLVQRGSAPVSTREIPLTPRARRAIEIAHEVAQSVSTSLTGPEHLLVGLICQKDGVAGVVLSKLGFDSRRVAKEALKTRVRQMRIIERAVRPVHAGTKYKRRIREELLGHLTAIYEEELKTRADPEAALEAAAKRFGDPRELSSHLQTSVRASERRAWHVEQWLGWRAPEPASAMVLRSALVSLLIVVLIMIVGVLVSIATRGWVSSDLRAMGMATPLLLMAPALQLVLGLCYYKVRDSLWGVFGSRRSRLQAACFSMLAALSVAACGLAFVPLATWMLPGTQGAMIGFFVAALFVGVMIPIRAKARGPVEIRDTIWATLDLKPTS
jgi:hypothetical protein